MRINQADAVDLGIKWKDKYYIDQTLAFGAIHGTAIFERITDFVRFLMAKKGFQIHNYVDDLHACCHENQAEIAFQTLPEILNQIGLLTPQRFFPPCRKLSFMGIIVDIDFSVEKSKLSDILREYIAAFLRTRLLKQELQSLLGKLLYISRCVKNS